MKLTTKNPNFLLRIITVCGVEAHPTGGLVVFPSSETSPSTDRFTAREALKPRRVFWVSFFGINRNFPFGILPPAMKSRMMAMSASILVLSMSSPLSAE
jgi:hypothetical protein